MRRVLAMLKLKCRRLGSIGVAVATEYPLRARCYQPYLRYEQIGEDLPTMAYIVAIRNLIL